MSLLKQLKKKKTGRKAPSTLRTGFDVFDYANAIHNEGTGEILPGFDSGKIALIIGFPSSGKTTLAIQIMANILKHFETTGTHYDIERSTKDHRLYNVIKDSDILDRYDIRDQDISIDSVWDDVIDFRDMKRDAKKKINKEYVIKNPFVKGQMILTPTPILIDSLVTFKTEGKKGSDVELKNNMTGAQGAGHINDFLEKLVNIAFTYEIPTFLINHIRTKVSSGPSPASVKNMGQNDALKGGHAQLELADLFIELRSQKSTEDDYKIKGFITNVKMIKSRANTAGRVFEMVFDQKCGFDNDLTNFQFLRRYKLLDQIVTDTKYTMGNFKKKYNEIPEFKAAFDAVLFPALEKFARGEID